MGQTISQKIDAYAKAHLAELKKQQGLKNFTKFDIASIMLKKGALTQAEMNAWRSTSEGFSANNPSGSVFGFGTAGQTSYLEEMTDFSTLSPKEKAIASMRGPKFGETRQQRIKRETQAKQHAQGVVNTARALNTPAYQNVQAMKKYLSTLPKCNETFEETLQNEKFEKLDKKGKVKFLMEITGRKFYEAMEAGDKEAMKKYAIEGMSYIFAHMDNVSGITDIKDAAKKYSGLNALVDAIDKVVDDGNADNLSLAEKSWNTIKGVGDAVDGMIGTQGIAIAGSLLVASEAAATAGIGQLFAVVTQTLFGLEGAKLAVEGGTQVYNAETAEQAREGGAKLGMGGIMLYGAAKSAKEGYQNYKAEKAAQQELSNARKTLGIEDGVELTESIIKNAKKNLALKNHPDRGGSVEAMQEINNAANLLLKSLDTSSARAAVKPGKPAETTPTTPNTPAVQTSPSTYRAKLPTPDYSNTRANFPADAHQSLSKPGKATAYTTDGKPDGIVYQGTDGKLYVPNKWDPEHPYEVNTGADGKPASVIMIYDEAAGDFAVGEPTTIASTYKNPATGELDPLYNVQVGKGNAMEIVKDQVPSAYKIVKPGTEIQTKEGPRVVQDGEIVVYDVDGDPYVMPKKNFLKRQEPLKGDAESEALYAKLKLEQDLSSKSGLSKKDIAEILENVNDDNISLANQICTDELFMKYSGNIKFVLMYTNKENLSLAKKLCTDKKFPIDLISHLIRNANKENMALAEKLVVRENSTKGWYHIDDIYDIRRILEYTNKDNLAFAEKLFAEKRFTMNDLADIQTHTSKYGLEFADKLCKNKELSTRDISSILLHTNRDNLTLAEKLCADKEFPKAQIGSILEDITKENLALAEKLCADKEFPKNKIGYILGSTKKDNLALAEKLCTDKVVPVDQAIDILRTTDYGLVSPEKINIGILKALSSKLYTMKGNVYIPGDKNYIEGVISAMNKYPDFTNELANFKVDGKQFFSDMEVNDILYNCLSGKDNPAAKPEDIRKILNNPRDIEFMKNCKGKAFGLFKTLFY